MPRIQNIGFQLKQSLRAMAAFGESKKAYKEETSRLRTEYKNRLLSQGYSKKDAHKMAQSICTYRDKIFSQSTLSAYQKAAGVFEQFCQETLGTKRLTLEDAKNHCKYGTKHGNEKQNASSASSLLRPSDGSSFRTLCT